MDAGVTIATLVLAAVTFALVVVAALTLRGARADAKAARTAELSWKIYKTYDSPDLRTERRMLNDVSRRKRASGGGSGAREEFSKVSVRRILRFYHQIGILLDNELIDPRFIFPLIGDGLITSEEGIKAAVEWYQNYRGPSGEDPEPPKKLYENARNLPDQYRKWIAEQPRTGPATGSRQ